MQTMTKRLALTHYEEQARIAMLEQQRDELAAALRDAAESLDFYGAKPEAEEARAALAKIK